MIAAWRGYLDIVKVLIKAGVNCNDRDGHNETALIYAADCGVVDIVKLLIKAGADLNVKDSLNMNNMR